MKRKYAKTIAGVLCGIIAFATPIQSVATGNIAYTENGFIYMDFSASGYNGYSVLKADASTVENGTLTIPSTANGQNVIYLNSNFMSRSGAKKVVIGSEIIGLEADAFFEAKDIEEFSSASTKFTVSADDPALYTSQHQFLLDYPSAASNEEYTVHSDTKVIYSMDNAIFEKLNIGKVDTVAKNTFAGTYVKSLTMQDNVRTQTGNGYQELTLPGLHAEKFILTAGESKSYLKTDGAMLYTKDGTLIKLSSNISSGEVDWSRFNKIDANAFDSMAQYWNLSASIPQNLKKDVVFHFYNQNNGVFILNDQTAFCYDSDKRVPDHVTDKASFSNIIDGQNYDKVNAVMFAGVPYDGAGLFEQTFGISYSDALKDADMSRNGNAALNVVSSVIWDIVDGRPSDIIDGVGTTSYFTEENVQDYKTALYAAAENYQNYTFSPVFEINGNVLTFREQEDGTFLSDPFVINTIDGNGNRNDNYKINMELSGAGFSILGSNSMEFTSGSTIRLTSAQKPEGTPLTFTYKKGDLTYYTPGNPDTEQYLLVSGTKNESAVIPYRFDIRPQSEMLTISKRAVGGTQELPGASLVVQDIAGKFIEKWTSTTEAHIMMMPEDGTYTLTETIAPSGFQIADSITFVVSDSKVVSGGDSDNTITMYDAPTRKQILFSKRDITTNKELPGAKLKITDEEGNIVEQWVSADTPHMISDLFDGVYTLTEITAPNGYEVARSISFKVEDGTVSNGMIIMYDLPKQIATPSEPDRPATPSNPDRPATPSNPDQPATPSDADDPEETENYFYVSKRDVITNKELSGAKLKITDEFNNTVAVWTSTSLPYRIDELTDGTYKLIEVAAPSGYEIARPITFNVSDGTVWDGIIVMYDKRKSKNGSSGNYSGGSSGGNGNSSNYITPEPLREPVFVAQEVVPEVREEYQKELPKTNDFSPAYLMFLASLMTIVFVIGDKKRL